MYWPATPSAARWAVTKPFIAPLAHESCCGPQEWLLDGSACALESKVSMWNGSRYPSGLSASGW